MTSDQGFIQGEPGISPPCPNILTCCHDLVITVQHHSSEVNYLVFSSIHWMKNKCDLTSASTETCSTFSSQVI